MQELELQELAAVVALARTEPEFLNFQGAQESIPRNQFHQHDSPLSTRFLAPIDCLKILALDQFHALVNFLSLRKKVAEILIFKTFTETVGVANI